MADLKVGNDALSSIKVRSDMGWPVWNDSVRDELKQFPKLKSAAEPEDMGSSTSTVATSALRGKSRDLRSCRARNPVPPSRLGKSLCAQDIIDA